jgi:YegS/Rv2252/BmrU family lipid kinase
MSDALKGGTQLMKKRILFIVNPSSGTVKIKDSLLEVCQIFCEAGYELTLNVTKYISESIKETIDNQSNYDLIICCGGDGTFNSMISSLVALENRPFIGYIPSGSTNDFARSIGLTGSATEIARKIVSGKPQTIDIGAFNQYYFSYVASFGAFTEASYNTPQSLKNRLGHLAYVLEGVKDLSTIEPCPMKIVNGDTVIEGNYIWGAVCNSTSIGGMIRLNTDIVDFNDGLFEVMLIKMPKNLIDLTKIVVSINTQDYDPETITFFQASEVFIYPETEIPWTLDGEYAPGSREIHIRNIPNALQLVL